MCQILFSAMLSDGCVNRVTSLSIQTGNLATAMILTGAWRAKILAKVIKKIINLLRKVLMATCYLNYCEG